MPIRSLLQDGSFSPDQIVTLVAAFEDCLSVLNLVDRTDPLVLLVAMRVIDLSKPGINDPALLRDAVLKSFRMPVSSAA